MRKNNIRNKLLSMLLCCVMIVGMLPTNVLAAPNDFTIVGWESKGVEGAIASVKINGQTVPQNGGTLSIPPNITVPIEITFNPGFKIGSGVDGIVLQWGGIQSGYDNIKNSTDHTTIDMPDTNWFNTEDQELYLIIATTKIDYIKETEVTVPPILCGEGYTRGQIGSDWNPVPNISIPANADYAIKYAQWCVPDPNTPGSYSYISPSAPAVFRGGDEVYIDVGLKALVDDGFVLGLEPTATINGATKVESMYIESSQDSANDTVYYRMILKATVQHIPGEVVRENEIAAACTTDGSYDEVIYCTACSAELSRQKKQRKLSDTTGTNGPSKHLQRKLPLVRKCEFAKTTARILKQERFRLCPIPTAIRKSTMMTATGTSVPAEI